MSEIKLEENERLELHNLILQVTLERERLDKYKLLMDMSQERISNYESKLEAWRKQYDIKLKTKGIELKNMLIDPIKGIAFQSKEGT